MRVLALICFGLLSGAIVAQQLPQFQYTADGVLILNNQYIVNMTAAGLSTHDLAATVKLRPCNFTIDSAETLVRLYVDHKVPTEVLVAMADKTGTAAALKAKAEFLRMPVAASDPPRAVHGVAPASGSRPVDPVTPRVSNGKGPGLENGDVYEMVAKGVPVETIVKLVQSSPSSFRLYTDADFNEAHAKVPDAVLKVMAEAAGPRSVAAGRQWVKDMQAAASANAAKEDAHVAWTKAEIAKECPGCVAIMFYEYNQKTKKMIPAGMTWKLNDYLTKFSSLEYAKQHRIFVTTDPRVADYYVLENYDDGVLAYRREKYVSGLADNGEFVTLDMGQENAGMYQEYFAMFVLDKNRKQLFQTRHNRLGLWKEHNKADVDCWNDTEKFLHTLSPK